MFGIASPTGGVELIGLEIRCSGRGSVFLRPTDGLNVLYGRNGAGKSSILDGVRQLVSGVEMKGGAVALFRVSPALFEMVFDQLNLGWPVADPTVHSLPPQHNRRRAEHPIGFWLRRFGTLTSPTLSQFRQHLLGSLEPAEAEALEAMRIPLAMLGRLSELDDSFPADATMLTVMSAIASIVAAAEPVSPNEDTQEGWPLWYLSQLRRALASDLEIPKPLDDPLESPQDLGFQDDMLEFFAALGLDAPALNLDTLTPGDLQHHSWEDLASLLVYREVTRARREFSRPQALSASECEAVRTLLQAMVDSRLVAISGAGSADRPRWRVELAAEATEPTGELFALTSHRSQDAPQTQSPDFAPKLGRILTSLANAEATADEGWHGLAETAATLSDEERAGIEGMANSSIKLRMLSVYHSCRELPAEERASTIEAGLAWATSPDVDEDELGDAASLEEIRAAPSEGSAHARANDSLYRLLVESSIDNGRYAKSGVGFETTAFPWAVCDLDDCPEPAADLSSAFQHALEAGPLTAGTFVDFDEDYEETVDQQLESEPVTRLQTRIAKAGERLAHLGLGVGGLRLHVNADIRSWLARGPLTFEGLDSPSQRWVGVAALSAAQQKWVARVLHLENALEGGFPLIILADEPETGVHTAAAYEVFRLLESTAVTSLVATHAPAAFRIPAANLVLVDRDFSGSVVLGTPGTGDDVRVAAVRVGMTPLDLLNMKRLLVYVEGSHDEVVVNTVISHSADPGLKERVIVAPARGVRQLGGVAASVLLTEFTDLHTLVIADNARTGALESAKAEALDLLQQGIDAAAVKRRLRLSDRAGDSLEERVLWDLLERCIDRHVLHRVHFHGLEVGDIVETLPPAAFGLSEPWRALRSQFPAPRGVDFKGWLRQSKSASISIRTIRDAVASLDALPEDLLRVLRAVESADRAACVV